MIFRRVLPMVLSGLALVTAHGAEGFPIAGRLTGSDGVTPLAPGRYRLLAELATNATDGVFAKRELAIETDARGFYATVLPLDAANPFPNAATLFLRQSVLAQGGGWVSRPPAQRIGFVPYAFHAPKADVLATAACRAVGTLAAETALVRTLAVTNGLVAAGMLVVTGALDTAAGTVTRVERLRVGSTGSSLLSPGAWTAWRCPSDETSQLDFTAAHEGVFELEIDVDGGSVTSASIVRTSAAGAEETLFARDGAEMSGGMRRYAFPVRTGDVMSVSVTAGATGLVRLRQRFVSFGMTAGHSSGEGGK